MQTTAANKDWWFSLSPQKRREFIEKNPKSEYNTPPFNIHPDHTQALVNAVAKAHYGKKSQ